MENNENVTPDTQIGAEPTVQPAAPVVPQTDDELVKKNQELFARAKKAEEELKEIKKSGEPNGLDSAALEKRIEEKVNLRMKGYTAEQILEMEKYAKGAGLTLSEAEQVPFVKKAVDGMRAESKSIESTPAPSAKIMTFNGKPVDEIFKTGTAAEKQAAWEARLKGGVKSSE